MAKLGVVVLSCNFGPRGAADTGGLRVQGQPETHSEMLPQTNKQR